MPPYAIHHLTNLPTLLTPTKHLTPIHTHSAQTTHSLKDCHSSHKNPPPGNTPSNRLPDQYTLTPIANSTPGSVKNLESVDISGISSIQTAPKKCDFFKIEKGMYQGGNFRDFLQFFGALFQQSVWVESHSGNCSGVRIQIQVLSISPLWLHWKAEQRAEVSLIRNAASSTS